MPSSNRSLVITTNPKRKDAFRTGIELLFYNLQNDCLNKSYIFFEEQVSDPTLFQDPTLSDASVALTSNVRT
jgi:hypothetical protein